MWKSEIVMGFLSATISQEIKIGCYCPPVGNAISHCCYTVHAPLIGRSGTSNPPPAACKATMRYVSSALNSRTRIDEVLHTFSIRTMSSSASEPLDRSAPGLSGESWPEANTDPREMNIASESVGRSAPPLLLPELLTYCLKFRLS